MPYVSDECVMPYVIVEWVHGDCQVRHWYAKHHVGMRRVTLMSCHTLVPLQHTATHCNTLQTSATRCNTLQHTATHCNTLQHAATHCNTLQHTATHCNTLQHTATHCNTLISYVRHECVMSRVGVEYAQRLSSAALVCVMSHDIPNASCRTHESWHHVRVDGAQRLRWHVHVEYIMSHVSVERAQRLPSATSVCQGLWHGCQGMWNDSFTSVCKRLWMSHVAFQMSHVAFQMSHVTLMSHDTFSCWRCTTTAKRSVGTSVSNESCHMSVLLCVMSHFEWVESHSVWVIMSHTHMNHVACRCWRCTTTAERGVGKSVMNESCHMSVINESCRIPNGSRLTLESRHESALKVHDDCQARRGQVRVEWVMSHVSVHTKTPKRGVGGCHVALSMSHVAFQISHVSLMGMSRVSVECTRRLPSTALARQATEPLCGCGSVRCGQPRGHTRSHDCAWYVATHCHALLHTATHCNILPHTATHCNTLQHPVGIWLCAMWPAARPQAKSWLRSVRCNILQHTATYCNILQHTASHCKALRWVLTALVHCAP